MIFHLEKNNDSRPLYSTSHFLYKEFAIKMHLLTPSTIHSSLLLYTYSCIILTFIGYLLNVKNQDVCWNTKINPTSVQSLPSENSEGKPRGDTERRPLKQGVTPCFFLSYIIKPSPQATSMPFQPLLLCSSLWIWWAGTWRRQTEWTSPSRSTRAAAAWLQTSRSCPQQFTVHPGSHLYPTWGTR